MQIVPIVLELQVKSVWRVRKGKGRFDMDEGSVNSKGQHQSTFREFSVLNWRFGVYP